MNETCVSGKLLVDGKQLKVCYRNRNGNDVSPTLGRAVMSPRVAALPADDSRHGTQVEVILKLDQMPRLVRLPGEPATEPAPATSVQSSHGQGKGKKEGKGRGKDRGGHSHGSEHERSHTRSAHPPASASQERSTQPADHSDSASNCFHNPYNFIPALSRNGVDGELGDSAPRGHHCLFGERYTGWIEIELTTATPLLLPDAAAVDVLKTAGGEHKKFPARKGSDQKPYLHPASVKGALSSAYEAATNSRLRVFAQHEARLAYRMDPNDALRMIPARVDVTANSIELLLGDTAGIPLKRDGKWVLPGADNLTYAAWLETYDPNGGQSCKRLTYAGTSEYPRHGELAWVWLERFQHWSRKKSSPDFKKDFPDRHGIWGLPFSGDTGRIGGDIRRQKAMIRQNARKEVDHGRRIGNRAVQEYSYHLLAGL